SHFAAALQEALVSLWREMPRLRSIDAFSGWADRVLVNACRLVLRRRSRRRLREIALPTGEAGTVGAPGRAAPAFDVQLADRETFDRAFETLEAEDRALLVLHHLEGRSVADLASALRIPTGTAKSRLFHARRRLDQALDRDRADGPSLPRAAAPGPASRVPE